MGATRKQLIKALGVPDKGSTETFLQWKNNHHVHCLIDEHRGAFELRFDIGFAGTTTKGITLGSSEEDVLAAYGKPDRIVTNNQAKMLEWPAQGILVWLTPGNGVHQIVVFPPYALPYNQPAADSNANPVGRWTSVDFVSAPELFNPQVKSWPKELDLKALTFQSNGQTDRSFWTWSEGILHHSGDNTYAKFFIKQIDGKNYLFMEWMSGDVMLQGQPSKYYVLKREDLKLAPPSQLNPVAYEQTPHTFKVGDDIVLNEVLCSSRQFAIGDTVTVKGQYSLSSQSEATLLLTCTGGQSSTTETQRKSVTKGSGEFELTYVIPYQGCSHLAFYDKVTHKSFGNLWFGTKEQVEEIEPTRKSMQSAGTDNDTAQIEKTAPFRRTATPPNQSKAAASPLISEKTARVWQQTESYSAPDFYSFFPNDPEGGKTLDALWNAEDKDSRSDDEILKAVRNGLCCTKENKRYILRWIGNRYIWNKSPQNPDAIEIMYHAADFSGGNADPQGTRHYAVYFGLSVVQPKTPAILRTLVDLCMRVDDPNDLSRVVWGAASQRQELLEYLKPYLESENKDLRNKATVLEQMFEGQLNAFYWAKQYIKDPSENSVVSAVEKPLSGKSQAQTSKTAGSGRASDETIAEQKARAEHRMREDLKTYSQDELQEIESLYQVANKKWRSEEGKESLRKLVSKYKSANRTGCALLYLGQMSTGDEQIEYLQQAIDSFSDCFYGDGAQVGAYARFVLLCRYHRDGEKEKTDRLAEEIRTGYSNAIDHRGRKIVDLLESAGI